MEGTCPHSPTPCPHCCHPWPPDPSHQVHILCAPLFSGVSISSLACPSLLGHLSLHRTGCLSFSWGVCLSFQWPLGHFPIHRDGGWLGCLSVHWSVPLPIMASPWTSFSPSGCCIPAWVRWAESHRGAVPSPLFHHSLPQTLTVWCGAWSNVLKHSRMQELAAASYDSERGGKAHLEIVADGEEPPEMGQVCPHWAERGIWVSLGWLRDPPVSSPSRCWDPSTPCRRAALRSTWWLTRATQGQLSPTRQGPLMAPGLGMPKCHHGGHRRYMRLGTARVHHDSPPGVHEVGHGPGTIW